MFDVLKVRYNQGYQAIRNIRKAEIKAPFRGLPAFKSENCELSSCNQCVEVCPTGAIQKNPFSIDLGKCVFCGECQRVCQEKNIQFSQFHKTASTSRDFLRVTKQSDADFYLKNAVLRDKKWKIFKRSFKLRQVSAGGCNACEMEINACSNVNFDMGRFGIEMAASPRHADGLLITGPLTQNMAFALEEAYLSTPEPKVLILAGTCAISGGIFQNSPDLNREFLNKYPVHLYIPGCPVHPLTIVNGILDFIGRK